MIPLVKSIKNIFTCREKRRETKLILPPEKTPKYFKPDEVKNLRRVFVNLLDKARELAGIPFIITSGFRSGGTSSHSKGLAVDLKCKTSRDRFLIVKSALDPEVAVNRIGIYVKPFKCPGCTVLIKSGDVEFKTGHVHIDASLSHDQNVMWIGISK